MGRTVQATTPRARLAKELALLGDHVGSTELTDGQLVSLSDQVAKLTASCQGEARPVWWRQGPDYGASYRRRSPFCGAENPRSFGMSITNTSAADRISSQGCVSLDHAFAGPPHAVHGGVLAGLFDEVVGAVARQLDLGGVVVTAMLKMRFRKPTPLDTPLLIDVWIARQSFVSYEGLGDLRGRWICHRYRRSADGCAASRAPDPTVSAVVRRFTERDLDAVLVLNNAAVPAVNELEPAALAHLWQQSSHFVVADVDGSVAGFLLLLDGPGRDYDSINYSWFSARYDRFFYVDRIVVADSNRGGGIGRTLYDWAIEQGSSIYPVLCAEVNIRPRNQPSLDFHAALDFVEVGQQDIEDGQRTVVMLARPMP